MTTHYIPADDYDRWNPGEPIEDVASDTGYLYTLYATSINSICYGFDYWLKVNVSAGNIIRIETDENGNIPS